MENGLEAVVLISRFAFGGIEVGAGWVRATLLDSYRPIYPL